MVQRYPTQDKQGREKWCILDVSSRIALIWFRFWTYSTVYRIFLEFLANSEIFCVASSIDFFGIWYLFDNGDNF